MDNRTSSDAFARITQAKMGSLAGNPTDEFILAMVHNLYIWIGELEEEVARRVESELRADSDEEGEVP